MALTIVEYLRTMNPNIGLVVNPDGSYRISVEDVNSDEILAAIIALETDIILAAGSAVIGRVGHDTTSVGDGRQTVTNAGARVALAGSTACKWVLITAETDNTDIVVVGAVTCVAALATRRGTPLYAGESALLLVDNLADVYADSLVNTEGVTFVYGV